MEQRAVVKEIEGQVAKVFVVRQSACAGDCDSCHGCNIQKTTVFALATNTAGARVGDRVIVTGESKQILSLAVLLYIMPLFLMIGAFFVVPGGELTKALCSMIALCAGLVLCAIYSKRMKKSRNIPFEITKILGN